MESFNANQPDFYQGIGNSILKEGIFERFKDLIPAVGDHYRREDNKHSKLLLIGESNYFKDYPESISVFKNAEKWYHEDTDKLIPIEMKIAVNNWKGGYRTFENVYKIMDSVLEERGIEHLDYLLQEAAFYNYFLRPAFNQGKNKGFNPEPIDKEISGIALTEIIKRLSPDLVIFLSKKAYHEFETYCRHNSISFSNIHIESVVHPASIWWNRAGGWAGKAKMKELLEQYWCKS